MPVLNLFKTFGLCGLVSFFVQCVCALAWPLKGVLFHVSCVISVGLCFRSGRI